jgi:phosphodiesterase/alkaline phosphatase D-like protein
MKALNKYLLLIVVLLAFNTCEKDPTNPFDSDTPKEIWTPSNFTAVQSEIQINLTWTQKELNISGFKIERKVGNQEWSNIATPGKTATAWTDNSLTGGVEHQYKLYAYAGDNQSNTVSASITPILKAIVNALPVANLQPNSATLKGNVNPNGSSTTVTFLYKKKSSTDWISTDANPKVVNGNSQVEVIASITNLSPGEEYHYKVRAINSSVEELSGEQSFITGCNLPQVAILETTNIQINSATLNGQVSANGSSTQVTIEYGETTNYGLTVAASPATVTGNNINVSANVAGLKANTKYYYKIKATNCGGVDEKPYYFTTVSDCIKPTLGVNPSVTGITVNSVKLNGQINPNGKSTNVTFEYGETTNYGSVVTASPSPISTNNLTNVSAIITGLQSCKDYYYRIKAENCGGTTISSSANFTTSGIKPSATTLAPTNVTNNSVTLNGQVNANGSPTAVTFVYYSMPGNYKTVTATPSTVTGTNTVNVSANVTGLSEGLLYSYHVKAENCGGTTNGSSGNFTTTGVSSFVEHIGISKTKINLSSSIVLGQITINPVVSGKVIVTFDGMCVSSPGDRIVLAASNTTSWGANYGQVSVEAVDSDVNGNSFSHTRVYEVNPGGHSYFALAQNVEETGGSGIASVYGSLTVEFIPASNSIVGYLGISKTNLNLTNETTVGTVTINPTVSGQAIVRFSGYCISSPGDGIVLAASNTASTGVNDAIVIVEAINSDINIRPFSHTRVYNVSPGSRSFYAMAEQSIVEHDGTGIASIYGSLTVEFVQTSSSIVGFTGINRTSLNLSNETTLGQVTINPTVKGKVLVRFDGMCLSSPGDLIVLAASNTQSWEVNDGNVAVEALDTDLRTNSFSHTRVYSVSPGSKTFYAVGHNYVETDGNGIASIYGSLTVIFFPD